MILYAEIPEDKYDALLDQTTSGSPKCVYIMTVHASM